MKESADRRSARTKKALKSAMLELLDKKEISKITVSELAQMADIGRGTFYLHYADPYDLRDKLDDELLAQTMGRHEPLLAHWSADNLLAHLENVWQYIYENKEAFKILMHRRNGTRFIEKFRQNCEAAAFSRGNPRHSAEYYGVVYVTSGTLGIFQSWLDDGATMPPAQLAQIVRNLIMGMSGE